MQRNTIDKAVFDKVRGFIPNQRHMAEDDIKKGNLTLALSAVDSAINNCNLALRYKEITLIEKATIHEELRKCLILKKVIERVPLPDNALRMIEHLELHQKTHGPFHATIFNNIIKDLLKAKAGDEKAALNAFKKVEQLAKKYSFDPSFLKELHLASLTNRSLLNAARSACQEAAKYKYYHPEYKATQEVKKEFCREVEGRLLRVEKTPKQSLGIELELNKQYVAEGSSSAIATYGQVISVIEADFEKQLKKIRGSIPDNNAYEGTTKEDVMQRLKTAAAISIGNTDAEPNAVHTFTEDTYQKRNDLLKVQNAISEEKNVLKKSRDPKWLSDIHAAFVTLGCIAGIGLIYAIPKMIQSYLNKGTLLFTHAPETQKITHQTEKSFHKLGRIKK